MPSRMGLGMSGVCVIMRDMDTKLTLPRYGLCLVLAVVVAAVPCAADEPRTLIDVDPSPPAQKSVAEKITDYYAEMYGRHLSSGDWFIRALGLISLGRIDAPATTEKILSSLEKDRDALVRLYAWEVLHARTTSLTREQHERWVAAGVQTAVAGAFRGDLRAGLVSAMQSYGADGFNGNARKVALKFLDSCSHRDPRDSRTLAALRKVVAAWRDPTMIKLIASKLTNGRGNALEFVLGDLKSGIKPVGSLKKATSAKAWSDAKSEWTEWAANIPPGKGKGRAALYKGTSWLIPAAEELNARDPKWRQDLELDKLVVTDFDLVFCIDATGSMQSTMTWIARDVTKMMAAFKLVAREPRIGTVYFRHEIDPKLQHDCCKKALSQGKYASRIYQVRMFALTGSIDTLSRRMLAEEAGRNSTDKSFHPGGAAAAALHVAVKKQIWKQGNWARKIIVMVGDSPVTPGATGAANKLAAEARKEGFQVHSLIVDRKINFKSKGSFKAGLETWEAIAKAGGGKAIWLDSTQMKSLHTDLSGKGGKGGKGGKASSKSSGKATATKSPAKAQKGAAAKKAAAEKAAAKKAAAKKAADKKADKTTKQPAGRTAPRVQTYGQIAEPSKANSSYQMVVGEIIRSMLPEGYRDRVDPLVSILMAYTDTPAAR